MKFGHDNKFLVFRNSLSGKHPILNDAMISQLAFALQEGIERVLAEISLFT